MGGDSLSGIIIHLINGKLESMKSGEFERIEKKKQLKFLGMLKYHFCLPVISLIY